MSSDKAYNFLEQTVNRTAKIINIIGVCILTFMMFITTADVFMRYVLKKPLLGTLELTEFMMAIFVAFSLAYTAVQKGHINVDFLISRFSPKVQMFLNSFTCILSIAIFFLISWRSILYAENTRAGGVTSQALLIPVYPFVLVIAFGSAMVCLVLAMNLINYLAQMVQYKRWWLWAGLAAGLTLTLVPFSNIIWEEGLIWQATPFVAGLLGIGLLILLLFSGMPVGVVMGLIAFAGMAYLSGLKPALTIMGTTPYTTASSYSLSIVPLFVLMGAFCFHSGLSRDLYRAANVWLGHMPGGLAMATVGGCAAFAAVSGSSVATAATMGTVALPEMKRYNYDPALATGCIAAGGSIGILIPPSVILVLYGILAEQSIGKLFLAGFIPGVLEAVFYLATIYIICKHNPHMGAPGAKTTFRQKLVSLKQTGGVLALFVLVMGGIYMGVFSPTEAAGVGAFGAFIFALGRRRLTWKSFTASLFETANTTAMVFVILIGAMLLGYFLAVSRLPFTLSSFVSDLPINRYYILAIIMLVYLFLGAIMSSLAMIILTVPIFLPVITALGFDAIWFGILIVRVVEIGQITPPVGINVYIIKGIAKDTPLYTIFRGIIPFLIADICHVTLIIAVPQIVMFLPNFMK